MNLMLFLLILVGVADLVLYLTGNRTISQAWHKLLPAWANLCCFIGSMAVIYMVWGDEKMTWALFGGILGHLMLYKYEK
jgi:hypothetical protein